eukprot:GHVQ01024984.1.p1 GENE.GHVQ01024984.1~~GHVQ01024984.1.p1  ORF type:complete len:969 (+),score=170.68 GHVQ01024984.1:559-3465(+)
MDDTRPSRVLTTPASPSTHPSISPQLSCSYPSGTDRKRFNRMLFCLSILLVLFIHSPSTSPGHIQWHQTQLSNPHPFRTAYYVNNWSMLSYQESTWLSLVSFVAADGLADTDDTASIKTDRLRAGQAGVTDVLEGGCGRRLSAPTETKERALGSGPAARETSVSNPVLAINAVWNTLVSGMSADTAANAAAAWAAKGLEPLGDFAVKVAEVQTDIRQNSGFGLGDIPFLSPLPLPRVGKCSAGTSYTITSGTDLRVHRNDLECIFQLGAVPSKPPVGMYYGGVLSLLNSGLFSEIGESIWLGKMGMTTQCRDADTSYNMIMNFIWNDLGFPAYVYTGTLKDPILPGEVDNKKPYLFIDYTVNWSQLCPVDGGEQGFEMNGNIGGFSSMYFVSSVVDVARVVGFTEDGGQIILGKTFFRDIVSFPDIGDMTIAWWFIINYDKQSYPLSTDLSPGQSLGPVATDYSYYYRGLFGTYGFLNHFLGIDGLKQNPYQALQRLIYFLFLRPIFGLPPPPGSNVDKLTQEWPLAGVPDPGYELDTTVVPSPFPKSGRLPSLPNSLGTPTNIWGKVGGWWQLFLQAFGLSPVTRADSRAQRSDGTAVAGLPKEDSESGGEVVHEDESLRSVVEMNEEKSKDDRNGNDEQLDSDDVIAPQQEEIADNPDTGAAHRLLPDQFHPVLLREALGGRPGNAASFPAADAVFTASTASTVDESAASGVAVPSLTRSVGISDYAGQTLLGNTAVRPGSTLVQTVSNLPGAEEFREQLPVNAAVNNALQELPAQVNNVISQIPSRVTDAVRDIDNAIDGIPNNVIDDVNEAALVIRNSLPDELSNFPALPPLPALPGLPALRLTPKAGSSDSGGAAVPAVAESTTAAGDGNPVSTPNNNQQQQNQIINNSHTNSPTYSAVGSPLSAPTGGGLGGIPEMAVKAIGRLPGGADLAHLPDGLLNNVAGSFPPFVQQLTESRGQWERT